MRRTGLEISPLAKAAGLAATTLARKDKPEFKGFAPSTIEAVKNHYKVPGPEEWSLGFAEDDATPYEAQPSDEAIVNLAKMQSASADIWRISSRALALEGYHPGDFIVVDLNATAQDGDIVIAQAYDFETGAASTVLRKLEDNFLLAKPLDTLKRPPMDARDRAIAIKGVVVASYRLRKKNSVQAAA